MTLVVAAVCSANTFAEDLYGGIGRGSGLNPGAVITVDQANGAGVLVGDPVTPGGLSGLAFDSGNRLWGSTIDGPSLNRDSDLVEIDDATGALISSVPILDGATPIAIGDLAVQPGTNIIFGITANAGVGPGGLLYTIDLSGAATLIGSTGQNRGGGLAFAPDGTLYYAEFNQLHTLDPATGAPLTTIAISGPATDGLAVRPSDGTLFTTQAGAGSQNIGTLDAGSGVHTTIGATGVGSASDLAFTQAFFDKEIVSGNDIDVADGIDMAVEVGIEDPSMYDFKINYNQPDWPPVIIEDTVPAEWRVVDIADDGLGCVAAQANKGKKDDKSATRIVCEPASTQGMATIWAEARCHGNRNNSKCRPTSCGALYLNNGAAAYEIDPDTGLPAEDDEGNRLPPLGTTNALCLVAVEDLDGGGIDYTGMGDEDGDGLADLGEACEIGTDPCLEDTDGDGVSDFDEVASGCMDPLNPDTDGDTINDGDELNNGTDPCSEDSDDDGVRDDVDACPLEGPADPGLGEILQPDGCIRQSQCSDGVDNEPDGNTDFPDDASCDDILDDSEDTVDPSLPDDCVEANGLTWCFNNAACGEACNDVCAAKGLTPVADSNAWFEAQNTVGECQAIADALGGGLIPTMNSWTFGCLEDSYDDHSVDGGLVGPNLFCSTLNLCPDNHRTAMDQLGVACGPDSRRSICPCE